MNLKPIGILWTDCLGGLTVGTLVLVGHQWIAQWHNLDSSVVVSMAFANLFYGGYSLFVTTNPKRTMVMVSILAAANVVWLFVCCAIVTVTWTNISLFGITHILGEGIYVGGLGMVEWNRRSQLVGE